MTNEERASSIREALLTIHEHCVALSKEKFTITLVNQRSGTLLSGSLPLAATIHRSVTERL